MGNIHDHNHDHDHELGHAHGANERRVFWAMVVTGAFMVVEVVGGIISGSLALLADAGHMLGDFVALALAFAAFRLSRRPADSARSYGYDRFQVLAAFVNGLSMLVIAAWIIIEGVQRLLAPQPVLAGTMLLIACVGLLVNVIAFAILTVGGGDNLNVRGAALHVLGDLLGSVAAVAASLIIMATGWLPADPLLSLLVAGLIIRSGLIVTRRSAHILLEGTPDNVSRPELDRRHRAAARG